MRYSISMEIKQLSTYVGRVFTFLSFGFLAYLIYRLDLSKIVGYITPTALFYSMILMIFFAGIYLFNASAWRDMLRIVSGKDVGIEAIPIYLETVVMKYLPGNVFQFFGRHQLSKKSDLTHKEILLSNSLEILFLLLSVLILLVAGGLFFDFSFHIFGYHLDRVKILILFLLLLMGVGSVLVVKGFGHYLLKQKRLIIMIWIKNTLFLIGSALTFIAVFYLLLGLHFELSAFFYMLFAAWLAWLLGFVVPGSPGGIGIRESVYVVLLPSVLHLSQETILAGALYYRLVSIGGEALTYFASKFFKDHTPK